MSSSYHGFYEPIFSSIDELWGTLFFQIRGKAPYFKSSLHFELWRGSKVPLPHRYRPAFDFHYNVLPTLTNPLSCVPTKKYMELRALTTEILAVLAAFAMETASWYDKKGELTFSDIIAIVRRSIWANKYCSKSENQLDLDKCSEERINSLIYQLTLAA